MQLDAPTASVLERLLSAPGQFDFAQAVDLLRQHARRTGAGGAAAPGRGSDPRKEALALTATFELSFRSQPIERIALGADGVFTLVANFFGLAGPDGPLPDAYVELIRSQLLEHDSGAVDFLSLFQHRLLSLAYRAEHDFRAAAPFGEPGTGPLAPALLALLGQQAEHADAVRRHVLLSNLPACAQQRHSLRGFLTLLDQQFGVHALGQEWAGRWIALPEQLQTVLGAGGRNDLLGDGAVLGQRAWDEGGAVRVDLGRIGQALYLALLPGGARRRELGLLCTWYLGPNLACYLRMALAPDEVPAPVLGPAALLGHTSWLDPAPAECGIELLVNDHGALR
ncbi:type VI secretion system baseplate subunit TssG [Massilia genomosp. 1]|uniref:Type VI secretion system baseplate subunit TssG n=1 Tax=Massilia genomosp. 1 TaxID=2609280 RepID=A0ABX0N0C8_9BURK|nr:type VI secretion system baseplate subunit TssG [Massilia genomosp. 1]NHZ66133.1 type VI secretion system baseplate subunit TssG [Massilia genomosp. 1]